MDVSLIEGVRLLFHRKTSELSGFENNEFIFDFKRDCLKI